MPNFMTPLPIVLVERILMREVALSTERQFRGAGERTGINAALTLGCATTCLHANRLIQINASAMKIPRVNQGDGPDAVWILENIRETEYVGP
jgi:hypothetical protein